MYGHLAIQTLAQAGLPAARTPQGRIGMVSLEVYDAEYVGQEENWAATADRMAARGLITPEDARRMRLLEAYGLLIANTDRHYGNISLLLRGTKNGGDWALSPTYDMLPMLYAPINGELVERQFTARPLYPTASTLAEWPVARELAAVFWRAAAAHELISGNFRTIALKTNHSSLPASSRT